jgi:serine/threonine protein kinase
MAVHFINSRNIIHRDVKPENILLKKESNGITYLHLSDFGIAKNPRPEYALISSSLGWARGTKLYLAPEILSPPKDKKNDISK